MKEPINDDFQITINIKWLVQIIVFVVAITGGWYAVNNKIAKNTAEIEDIQGIVMELEEDVDGRVARLEGYKEQELEEVNRSLLSKVLGVDKKKDD